MTMRKMLAILATLAILCTVLPLGTMFSAVADDANLIADSDFSNGIGKWYSSTGTTIEVVDGALHGDYNEDWGFIGYDITLETNTDYVLTFDAKAINNGGVTVKLNKTDWSGPAQQQNFSFGAEWATFTWEFNSGSYGPMWLYFQSDCEASANQEIWLDNLSLVKKAGGDAPVTPDEPSAGNLVVNGDFETGELAPWDNLWGSCTVSIVEGREGGKALQWACGQYQMTRQKVSLEKNTDYVLTAWAKDANALTFLVKDGADAKNIAQTSSSAGSEWKQYTLEFNSGDNDSVYISLMGNAAGATAVIDDVVLTKVGGETPDEPDTPDVPADGNLIVNGDFETGDASGWETWQSTVIEAAAAKDSAYGAHLIGGGSYGGLLNQTMSVVAGNEYKLSFWINVNAVGVNLQVKDGAGKTIEGAGGWFDANKKNTLIEYTFTATDDKVQVNFCGAGTGAAEDAYVDNFSLVATGNGGTPDEPVVDDALIKNGDFETGSLAPWDNLWDSCPTVEIIEGGKDSKYAVSIVSGQWSHVRQTGIPVDANSTYKVTAWAKNVQNMCLLVKDGGDSADLANVPVSAGDEWTEFTVEFNTDSYTTVIFSLMGGEGSGQFGTFDNIVMEKVDGGSEPDQPDQPDEPVTPPSAGLLNATFDTDEFDGVQSTCDISVADGELQFNVNKNWGNVYAELGVEPNTDYEITFRAKSKLGNSVWVKFHKIDWTGDIGEKTVALSTSMKEYKTTLNSGDNSSLWLLVQYIGNASDGETIWFDYINVKKIEGGSQPDVSDALVKNGDFETGTADGWQAHQSTEINTDAAYKGQYGANLIGNGGWGGLLNQDIKVENGETYIITLWVCVNATGANLEIKGATKVEGECDNTYLDAKELSGWTQRTFTVVATSDTLTLNFCGGGTGKAEDLYVDEIVVTKKGAAPEVDDTYPIKNAGFETGDLTSWENLWGSCVVGFDTPGHDKSNFALNFEGPGAWNQVRQDGIPVEPNTDYTLIAYVKNPININLVVKTANDSANIADFGVENNMDNVWIRQEVSFNSGDQTAVCVLIISNGDGNGSAIVDNVQIYKKGEEPAEPEPDAPATEGPMSLDEYGVSINRPDAEDANLIENGSFENAEGGQWQSVISDTLYVVDDETAPEGDKSLYFNTSGVTESNKVIFYLEVEPDTDYVFSAWVKGAFISADNRFNATFGVTDWKDNFCVYQDAKFSNKTRQIVPTAWDNEWHLRAVQFNSGVNTKVGIGFAGAESQMWIDGIALYKVEDGIKYEDERQSEFLYGSSLEKSEAGCADADNLLIDASMESAESQEFWASAEGYKNGFLSFYENEYEYGTSLKYTGDDKSCDTHAIKWLEVKPNTKYTFSVDIRVVKSGNGKLVLFDGKKRNCYDFLTIDFDKDTYGADWFSISVEFDTKAFDRIGIAIVDGGGEALLDNMRFFESSARIEGVKDDYVKPPYTFDEPENPDSPDTGVSALGAALAVALVPSSAFVAFKLRGKKKEDEE